MNKMKQVVTAIFFILALVQAQSSFADHHETAETPAVFEAFSCNYTSNRGANDLDKAVEFWLDQIPKVESADFSNYFAAIIKPIRSSSTADFYWLGVSPNLNEFAKSTGAYYESAAGQAADARFAKMSKCTSNLFFGEPLHIGSPPTPDNTEFVLESYGCTIRAGQTMADVEAVEAEFIAMSKAQGSKSNVYRLTPYLANTPADIVYFVGHNDMVTFGKSSTMNLMSAAGAASNQSVARVMDCNGSLNGGSIIHAPAAP